MLPFAALFKARTKSPQELVRSLVAALGRLIGGKERAAEECAKYLRALKMIALSETSPTASPASTIGSGHGASLASGAPPGGAASGSHQASSFSAILMASIAGGGGGGGGGGKGEGANAETLAQLAQEAYCTGLLDLIVANLALFDFESRKNAVIIFNVLVRRQIGSRMPTVEYVRSHPLILGRLVRGYEQTEVALNYGLMLRECLRHEALATMIFASETLYMLFDYVQMPTFDIASDAFATLKVRLCLSVCLHCCN